MRQSAVHFAIIRDEDNVTGAQVELSLLVDLPRPRLWKLVTDVARYGEWSPECEYTGWLDAAARRPPRVRNRFAGRNRFGKDFVTSVTCVVIELSRLPNCRPPDHQPPRTALPPRPRGPTHPGSPVAAHQLPTQGLPAAFMW